ncbi:hypothetical protein BIW11_04068, partial [Tropilaelaps mercedesae]
VEARRRVFRFGVDERQRDDAKDDFASPPLPPEPRLLSADSRHRQQRRLLTETSPGRGGGRARSNAAHATPPCPPLRLSIRHVKHNDRPTSYQTLRLQILQLAEIKRREEEKRQPRQYVEENVRELSSDECVGARSTDSSLIAHLLSSNICPEELVRIVIDLFLAAADTVAVKTPLQGKSPQSLSGYDVSEDAQRWSSFLLAPLSVGADEALLARALIPRVLHVTQYRVLAAYEASQTVVSGCRYAPAPDGLSARGHRQGRRQGRHEAIRRSLFDG